MLLPAVVMATVIAGPASGTAAGTSCGGWDTAPKPVGDNAQFFGVAVWSACQAWAVGTATAASEGLPIAEHWDGLQWHMQATTLPVDEVNFPDLRSASADSSSDVWAVGDYYNGTRYKTMIQHLTAGSWSLIPSPNEAGDNHLSGVAAISPSNVWAVGYHGISSGTTPLIEHWNGTKWLVVASPSIGTADVLAGVSAVSAKDIWAAGDYNDGTTSQTLIEHWDGSSWKRVNSPNAGTEIHNELTSVSAVSSKTAFAAGLHNVGSGYQPLVLRWNGTTWKKQKVPALPSTYNSLAGVAATSATNAWAAGTAQTGSVAQTLIEHWDGTSWKRQPSADPTGPTLSNDLAGLAASSATNAWAVGYASNGSAFQPIALHWGA